MGTPLALKIVVILALMLQFVAIVYALRLVRRTKYSAIWILCVIGFVLIGVERYFEVIGIENDQVGLYISIVLGVVVSICISVAVLFAHRLVNYLDRVDRQRAMFNRRIMTEVLRAEERSKQHFSKELHDGMGPLLSSAKMSLSALSQDGLSEQQRELLSNTIYILDQALRSVREISNNLSPQVLVDFGLSQAVENFTSRLSVMHGVVIRFNTTLTTERFDGDVEVIVYRVICELINNSLKHSGCTDIVLDLEYQDNTLTLNYADNGRGFDPETVTDCGMGLSNISSRISSLGGTFTINSAKGMGFKATAQVQVNS
ncbi:MAG: sensor histidine kinase [Alistipes sp.]|jgi:signal transduction histidine kinase|nr:sensor histidine kinase [Alistipes sp.]